MEIGDISRTGRSGGVPFGFISRFYAVLITVADPESFRVFTKTSLLDTGSFGEGVEFVSYLWRDLIIDNILRAQNRKEPFAT